MSQSDNNKTLSLFSAYEQIKTTLDAIEKAEADGHGMLVDVLISDVYAVLKDAEGGVDRVVGFIKFVEAEAEAIDEEIERLKELKKSRERRADRVKQLALALMDTLSVKTLEGKFGRRFTKVEATSVNILALDQIPDRLKRVTTVVEPDKKAIADELKKGGVVDGAVLVSRPYVRIT